MVKQHKDIPAFIDALSPTMAEIVENLRQIILSADDKLAEQIKWNSPCFYYTGAMEAFNPKEYKRDIAVMNVRKDHLLLIFPTGDRIADSSGLLEGNYTDGRRIIKFDTINDVVAKSEGLKQIIKIWIDGII